MNPFVRFEENPAFENTEDHGDIWVAIHKCYTRIAAVDERIRAALMYGLLPVTGFVVALLLVLLGLIIGHMFGGK